MELIREERKLLDQEFSPDGYNVGVNIVAVVVQSIFHIHIHIIPRYKGDVENPWGRCGM
jgi:diadenosine tetraphosphate (Ap4A) HIT family hydrolase